MKSILGSESGILKYKVTAEKCSDSLHIRSADSPHQLFWYPEYYIPNIHYSPISATPSEQTLTEKSDQTFAEKTSEGKQSSKLLLKFLSFSTKQK